MDDDYYSIDAILAENHKLTCTFTLDVPNLGYLEGGADPDIKALSKVEMPFWLAHTLSYNEFTTFPIPAPYSPRVRQALNASSTNVKLSHLVGSSGWWYAWGRRISSILDDQQRREMLKTLSDAWQQRLGLVYDLGSHYGAAAATASISSGGKKGGQGTGDLDADGGGTGNSAAGGGLLFGEEFKEGMDAEERLLFAATLESTRRMKSWMDRPALATNTRNGR